VRAHQISVMQSVLTASYQNFRSAAASVCVALGLWAHGTVATASPSAPPSAATALREAVTRQQWQRLTELARHAITPQDPLRITAHYWLLRAQFELAESPANLPMPVAAAQAFMTRHAHTYLAERLRGDWILAAARSGDFATVRRLGAVQVSNPAIGCAQLAARYDVMPKGLTAEDFTTEVLTTFAPNDSCWALVTRLVADDILGWTQLAPLWRAALEANQTTNARRIAELLLTPAQLKVYDKILRDPLNWLNQRSHTKPTTRVQREVLVIALARAARNSLDVTDHLLRRVWKPLLPADDHAWARSQLALVAALNLDARAQQWYREAGLSAPLTEYNHAWRARAALRQPKIDWSWLRQAIAHMPATQRAESVWVYWDARALAASGQADAAHARYRHIAEAHDYYGLLAAEELGRPATPPPAPTPISAPELAAIRAHPGLQRALALFRAGWREEAVPEWNFALRGMSDRELRAAAELARQAQIYDRVVNTSLRTAREIDFSQRYIAPFAATLNAQAQRIGLDAAWVYGLIRQESRFITDARSSVGAAGLMQLMPATARWTAQHIGMTNYRADSITNFDVNTELGTHYLKIVLQDLGGSQLLASAGYNAGPNRAKLWRARLTHPVEGAIFAETIPFTETRRYVKHVLANATWYAALFTGQPQSLKARLGTVTPQAGAATTQIP